MTTSAMLAETPERVKLWKKHRALCVDGETSILYTLSYRVEIALLAAVAASAGYALMDPFFTDVLFSTMPKEYRGTLLGSLAAVRRLIGIAMPAIAGFIAEINTRLPFILAAIIVIYSYIHYGLNIECCKTTL